MITDQRPLSLRECEASQGWWFAFFRYALEYYKRKMGLFYTSVYGLEWIKEKMSDELYEACTGLCGVKYITAHD